MFYRRVGSDPGTKPRPVKPGWVCESWRGSCLPTPAERHRGTWPSLMSLMTGWQTGALNFLCVQHSLASSLPGPNLVCILKYLFLIELNYSFIHQSPFMVFISVYWVREGPVPTCVCLSVSPFLSASSLPLFHTCTDTQTQSPTHWYADPQ